MGDMFQNPPVKGNPWYMAMAKTVSPHNRPAGGVNGAIAKSVDLLRDMPRYELTSLMRSRHDPIFQEAMTALRDTTVAAPLTQQIVNRLQPLTGEDIAADASWRFAPIGVISNAERELFNKLQIEAFAVHFRRPILRWRRTLEPVFRPASAAEHEMLFRAEDNLHQLWVEGGPALLTENVASTRGVVNGTMAIMHHPVWVGGLPDVVSAAVNAALTSPQPVYVDVPTPAYVIMRIGNGGGQNYRWHGSKLPDLDGRLPPLASALEDPLQDDRDQLVALPYGGEPEKVTLRSTQALAQPRLEVQASAFAYSVAFALTDFKLQGRTMSKLVLSLSPRDGVPQFTMQGVYVFLSRVCGFDGLRTIAATHDDVGRLKKLCYNPCLVAWNEGYVVPRGSDAGADTSCPKIFDPDKARAAYGAFVTVRNDAAARAEPPT
jgi:hypothetical protein